ncbi:DUF2809 domain-containing protein [Cellulomonas sp. Root137]|uniref:DUF2809 domain-containing protein n=1 Tax=Cellulomonas sp. Root137 TaxID=1736459 RepID=UPI000AA537EC|nr:DUF2809 domain-containing protein [Cellulomonas sp. Root137]
MPDDRSRDDFLPLAVTDPSREVLRQRMLAALAAAGLVALGLLVSRLDGPLADKVGDVLYAALVYALLVVVAPRARRWAVAAVAFGVCALVELAQLTGIPAAAVAAVPAARYVLGTTFVALDLVAYAVGAALAAFVRRPPVVPG